MKTSKTILVIASLVGTLGSASATTIAAGGGSTGAQFVTSTGVILTQANSTFQTGLYDGIAFTQFAPTDATAIAINTVAVPSFFGKWIGDASDTSNAADAFDASQVWFKVDVDLGLGLVGTAFLSSGDLFPTNANGVGDTITINSNELSTLGSGSTAGSAAYDLGANTVTIGIIPEPSTTALIGLGGLALILRRRK